MVACILCTEPPGPESIFGKNPAVKVVIYVGILDPQGLIVISPPIIAGNAKPIPLFHREPEASSIWGQIPEGTIGRIPDICLRYYRSKVNSFA